MRNVEIDKTFAAIRRMPPEVDFSAVEHFVKSQPDIVSSNGSFVHWLKSRNFIFTISSAIVIGSLILISLHNKTQSSATVINASINTSNFPTLTPAAETIEKPPAELSLVSDPVISEQSNIHPLFRPDLMKMLPVVNKGIALPASKKDNVAFINEATIFCDATDELTTELNTRVRTVSSCYCSFGDDDVWIKAFVRQMIKDGIIKDTANLRFTITSNSFKVNGSSMNALVADQYNNLYEKITKDRLNIKSSISLSVSEGSCSLSKSVQN